MWAWLVAYKYAEIKLPEVEKSQTSETHKSGADGVRGEKVTSKGQNETKEIVTAI